jgi:hypothetical protein
VEEEEEEEAEEEEEWNWAADIHPPSCRQDPTPQRRTELTGKGRQTPGLGG